MEVKNLKRLVIWGAGGHAQVVADIVEEANSHQIVGFVDNFSAQTSMLQTLMTYPLYTGVDAFEKAVFQHSEHLENLEFLIAIGDCLIREQIYQSIKSRGYTMTSVLHPKSIISRYSDVRAGSVVCAGAVIGTKVDLGENVIINTAASVDHHCRLGNSVHVCPGCMISGSVSIGDRTWIGVGTSIRNGIHIGDDCLIGAGSVIVNNIPDNVVAYGNPARVIRQHRKG